MISNSNALRQAAAAYQRGDLKTAYGLSKAALDNNPDDIALLQLIGVICCRSGDLLQGIRYLKKAFGLGGAGTFITINLARAYMDASQADEAERVCLADKQAYKTPEIQRLLGDIYKAQKKYEQASQAYKRAIALKPDDFESWNNLGNSYLESGKVGEAVEALRKADTHNVSSAIIKFNLGRAYLACEDFASAVHSFQAATKLNPDHPDLQFELGKALHRLGRDAEALPFLGGAARLNPTKPEVFLVIGFAFAGLADLKQAENAYRMSIRVNPKFSPGYLNLAIILEQANRINELDELLTQARLSQIDSSELSYIEALLCRRKGNLKQALKLARSVKPGNLDAAIRAHFIGQVADRLGLVDEAFAAFREMNEVAANRPEAVRYNGTEHRQYIAKLTEMVTPEWLGQWEVPEYENKLPSPAFLVGFLRSGTTLLDTFLMGHPHAHVLEEEPFLAEIENILGDKDLSKLNADEIINYQNKYFDKVNKSNTILLNKLVIDKNPLATLRAPLIYRMFPSSKFVFTVRHPCDVVLSCYMQNFKVSQAMASFLDLNNAARMYDAVMQHWEICQNIMPLNVHTIRYEDMIECPEKELKCVFDFLELEWYEDALNHQKTAMDRGYIRTPSYAQVTEQIYDRAKGRWSRYRTHMAEVLPILAPWAEKFGYNMD